MTISCTVEGLSSSGPSESSEQRVSFRPSGAAGTSLQDGVLGGPPGELRAAPNAGLVADAGEVCRHRASGDVQLPADLVVGHSLGHEAQDLELALAELSPGAGGRGA